MANTGKYTYSIFHIISKRQSVDGLSKMEILELSMMNNSGSYSRSYDYIIESDIRPPLAINKKTIAELGFVKEEDITELPSGATVGYLKNNDIKFVIIFV
jgi:hypothetical protein